MDRGKGGTKRSWRGEGGGVPVALPVAGATRARGEGVKDKKRTPGKKARRWVVECTDAWFNRVRSILARRCKQEQSNPGMLCCVCGLIAYRAAKFFGQTPSCCFSRS